MGGFVGEEVVVGGGDVSLLGARQAVGVFAVRDYADDGRVGEGGGGGGVDESLEVGPITGDENSEADEGCWHFGMEEGLRRGG